MLIRATAVSALALVLPALALAQSSTTADAAGPSFVAFASGGASPLSNLNDSGTDDLKTGWALGGGAGVQLSQYVAVRGVFDFTRNRAGSTSIAFPRQRFNHYFYGADVQIRPVSPNC